MHRRLGLTLMALLWLFAFLLSQRTVEARIGYRISPTDVTDWTIECGTTFPIIFDSLYSDQVFGPSTRELCTKAARTKLTEQAFIVLVGLGIGIVGVKNGPRRPRIPINDEIGPLPEFVPVNRRGPAFERQVHVPFSAG